MRVPVKWVLGVLATLFIAAVSWAGSTIVKHEALLSGQAAQLQAIHDDVKDIKRAMRIGDKHGEN